MPARHRHPGGAGARGRVVAEIDPDGVMGDDNVRAIRRAIILAVNVCGGISYRKV